MRFKLVLPIFLLLLGAAATTFWYFSSNNTKAQENNASELAEQKTSVEELIITPQTPTDNVVVDSASLNKDGFLIVRQMEGDKLSQIVEMSKPLKAGTHTNITIPLGSTDVSSMELIVMVYEDYENDGIFNDLDMPALNENGHMTARYVRTGSPLPATITEDSSIMPAHNMPGMKDMVKVRYTDKGFVPEKIEVKVGSMVEFTNESSTVMWVASADHPAHTKLPTFDQFRSFKKGAKYRYVFDKKGTWEYHDHISPSLGGVVTVK